MPSKGTWKRIDRCIYRNTETRYYRCIVSIGPKPESASFGPDTPLGVIKKWRDAMTAHLRSVRPISPFKVLSGITGRRRLTSTT
jgi:hypothetical protein